MNITLKQPDIEQALKMYLTSQGIALADRSFEVTFKAGRKGTGLSAFISIGLGTVQLVSDTVPTVEATVEHAVEAVAVVAPELDEVLHVELPEPVAVLPALIPTVPEPESMDMEEEVTEEPVVVAPPVKTPSLFA